MAQEILKKAKKNNISKHEIKKSNSEGLSLSEREVKSCPSLINEVSLFEKHLRRGGDRKDFSFKHNCPHTLYGKAYNVFQKTCLSTSQNKNSKSFGALCGQALFMLKATHAEIITNGIPLSEIFDLEPLIYKYFYRLFGPIREVLYYL